MSDGNFEYVQNFRILTDWQLRAVASQAAAAEYCLELRGVIERMVDDHGRATEKLLAEVRELRDRVGMHEVLRKTVHELLSKRVTTPSEPASVNELTYEPAAEVVR